MPVLTNLFALPAIWYNWRVRLYVLSVVSAIGMCISIFYHACAGWPEACFGATVAQARSNDYVWAPYNVAVMAVHVLNFYVFPWSSAVNYTLLAVIIFVQTLVPFSLEVFKAVLLCLAALLVVRATLLGMLLDVLVDAGDHEGSGSVLGNNRLGATTGLMFDDPERFSWPYLTMGLILVGIALAGFVIEDPATEWFTHAFLWHIPVFLAQFCLSLGTTRNSPWFPRLLRRLDGGSPDGSMHKEEAPTFYSAPSPSTTVASYAQWR